MEYVIGVDIGGTKIAAIVADSFGNIIQRNELPSIKRDAEEMFQQVVQCINELICITDVSIQQIQSMGIGIPGKVDGKKGIAVFQNNLPWVNFPVVERMKEQFPSIKHISIDNDVYMAAYAEWDLTDLPREATFVYVTVSTGISCSIIHNGKFLRGNGFAGELGLLHMEENERNQTTRTLENVASGPGLLRSARACYNDPDLEIDTLFLKYRQKDKQALKLINNMIDSLAKGLYTIICLIHPHQIVCGGGVINHQPYIIDLLNKLVSDYMIPEQQMNSQPIKISRLREDAGVIGASKRVLHNVSALK